MNLLYFHLKEYYNSSVKCEKLIRKKESKTEKQEGKVKKY